MRYDDEWVASVDELLHALRRDRDRLKAEEEWNGAGAILPMWYRGLSDAQYQLDSTLKRSAVRPAMERALVNRFKQNAGSFLSNPPTDAEEWEWMFIMRHHGAPSRLLDWSESPLVGLYFAAQEPHGRRKDDPPADGALWILLPEKLNARANIRSAGATDIPLFGDTGLAAQALNVYLATALETQPSGEVPPAAGIGKRNTPRMAAQQGVFTIFHASDRALEDWNGGESVWRYLIPHEFKSSVLKDLRMLGINSLSVFPDLDNVAHVAVESVKDG